MKLHRILYASFFIIGKNHFSLFYKWNLHGGNSRCDLTVMTNGDPYLTLSEKKRNKKMDELKSFGDNEKL